MISILRFPSPLWGGVRGGGLGLLQIGVCKGCRQTHFVANAINNTFESFKNIVVPETQDLVGVVLQNASPLGVIFQVFAVLAAVKFNNKLRIMTSEVGNVLVNTHLSAKMAALGF